MTTETHLLEMLGHGAPMLEVLNELCNFIDAKSPGAISTVFLLDSDGVRLRPVAGPNAPRTWKEEIDNLELATYAGFCSSAEGQGRAQTVDDIESDPLFAVHREAALRAALDPPPTEDLYFVANTEGGHFFSKTLEEHNRNVARYRRLLEESQNPSASGGPPAPPPATNKSRPVRSSP